MPGDPVLVMAGDYLNPEWVAAVRESWGLDKPVGVRLLNFLLNLLRGELGYSWSNARPVADVILERLPNTLLLTGTALLFGAGAGFLLGLLSARYSKSPVFSTLNMCCLTLYSTPVFWTGLLLMILFGIRLHVFPTSGMYTIGSNLTGLDFVADVLRHLFLPAFTLMIGWSFPIFFRITRAHCFDILNQDFIQTARSKGLSEYRILFGHVGKNSLLPFVTTLGSASRASITGAVLTEYVFGWPGMGKLVYEALFRRDYPLLLGVFMFSSFFVLVMSLVTDLLYAKLDPRVRLK